MGFWKDVVRKPLPFCRICFKYMSPAAAKAHTKHAKAISWPK
jgi:hypothetical protein